jgi:hypothetical protein
VLDTALSGITRFTGGHRDRYVAGEREIPLVSRLRNGQVGLPWQQGVGLDEVSPRLGDGSDRLATLLGRTDGQGHGPDRGGSVNHHPGDDKRPNPLPGGNRRADRGERAHREATAHLVAGAVRECAAHVADASNAVGDKQRELVIRLPGEDEGVSVGVPETGDQKAPRPVHDACPLGNLSRVCGPDLGDPVSFNDHSRLGTRRRSTGIDTVTSLMAIIESRADCASTPDDEFELQRLAPPARAPATKRLRVISLVRMASDPIRPEDEPLSRSERRDRREKYDPGSGNRRGIRLYEVVDTNRQHRWTVPTPSRE